jgi:hypothetical protein
VQYKPVKEPVMTVPPARSKRRTTLRDVAGGWPAIEAQLIGAAAAVERRIETFALRLTLCLCYALLATVMLWLLASMFVAVVETFATVTGWKWYNKLKKMVWGLSEDVTRR